MSEETSREQQRNNRPRGPHGALMMPVEKAHDARGTFARLLGYLKPQLPKIIVVVCFAVLGTCFNIFAPRVLGQATTTVFNGAMDIYNGVPGAHIDIPAVNAILMRLLALYIVYSACLYVQQFIMARVTQTVAYDLRHDLEAKFNRLPLAYYDKRTVGEVLSHVTNDIDLVASTLQETLTQLISAVVTLCGVIIMMLVISPLMTLIAFVTLPVSVFATMGVAKRSQRLFKAQQDTLGELNGTIEEAYAGHTVVRAYTREAEAVQTFDETNERYFKFAWSAQFVSGVIRPIMMLIGNLGYVGVCVAGGALAAARTITVGDIQAFLQYMQNFTQPITQIAGIMNTIQATLAAAERAFEVMDEPEVLLDPEEPARIGRTGGRVEFSHVRFGYTPDKIIIHDLSLVAEPGQTVAIVGPTGAGKSTLMNLLLRFYEIDGGSITLDGVDIRDMARDDLRAHFGMVLQDSWLFAGSIRDNIAYGREGATPEEVEAAAVAAHADHFIRALPDGYDTQVNEEVTNISAGQRQLVTIARALLADPQILILDEATSSIDTRTERLVQKAMHELMRGRTSFVIAHRLSTIRDAGCILVLRDGDIIEQGTHDELLAADGFYAELYNSQFAACDDAIDTE